MYHVNTILGNVGREPELKTFPNGQMVTSVNVAVNETWTDRETGERKEKTTWYRLNIWGNSAHNAVVLIKKGSVIFATGTVEAKAYKGQDGEPKASLEMRVNTWKLVGGNAARDEQEETQSSYNPETDDVPF